MQALPITLGIRLPLLTIVPTISPTRSLAGRAVTEDARTSEATGSQNTNSASARERLWLPALTASKEISIQGSCRHRSPRPPRGFLRAAVSGLQSSTIHWPISNYSLPGTASTWICALPSCRSPLPYAPTLSSWMLSIAFTWASKSKIFSPAGPAIAFTCLIRDS